ncbi:MAG: UDP-2,3-diacylglucosamine diphosphatase LpxG [Parachlamydia sp.]|jgi:hypothetical protein|nr:UDP-2,3-diacylglucosamine diphosphatase LpxG [Parachlamydia sp.]
MNISKKNRLEWIFDAACLASLIGVWPRFIEPRLLEMTSLTLSLESLPLSMEGFKIFHFSDLHWRKGFSNRMQSKLLDAVDAFKPDMIVFTGDFICRSIVEEKERLIDFLGKFHAPCGCYAVLGNHDYEKFVTVGSNGDYTIDEKSNSSVIRKGFKRLFSGSPLTGRSSLSLKHLNGQKELLDILARTSFQLLCNQTKQVRFKECSFNVTGLEEYSLAKDNWEEAFQHYVKEQVGIVLVHNPDWLKKLKDQPGDLILAGHTHGGQVNLPFFWKKFTMIESPEFKKGLVKLGSKWAYINRGISAVMSFRWFARPELTLIKLKKGSHGGI